MEYHCTLTSAKEYAEAEKLDEWIHTYLQSDGHNQAFSDGLKLYDRYYIGPIQMPVRFFHRCCGPEEEMTYRVDSVWFEKHVEELKEVLANSPDMPPLIVHYIDGDFELNDGNHRLEAYQRMGVKEIPVIVWITESEEKEEFQKKYGEYVKDAVVICR